MKNISVIIPVRNRLKSLCKCLDSIALQKCNIEFEVIVIDDGSEKEIPDMSKDYNLNLRIIKQVPLGIASARNRGIQEAKGDLLFFVDSDCTLQMDCLESLVHSCIQHPEQDSFQLRLIGDELTAIGKMEHLRLSATQMLLLQNNGQIKYLNTSGFAIRTHHVIDYELFDTSFTRGEDTALLAHLNRKNALPYHVTDSIVKHSPQGSISSYILKHFLIGYHTYAAHLKLKSTSIRLSGVEKILLFKKILYVRKLTSIHFLYIFLIAVAYFLESSGRLFKKMVCVKHHRSQVLDTVVDDTNENEIIHKITSYATCGKGALITYLTAWSLILTHRNSVFRKDISSADLVAPDGMGVVLTALLTNLVKIKKVTLHDYYTKLFQEIANRKLRIALVGGVPGLAEEAAIKINTVAPDTDICLCYTGYLQSQEQKKELLKKMIESQPQIVFVGMSQPVQERWISENRVHLPNTVFYCVGAFFEFITNRVNHLPESLKIIRIAGFEWLWRLIHSPRLLFKRYVIGLPHLFLLIFHSFMLSAKNNSEARMGGGKNRIYFSTKLH